MTFQSQFRKSNITDAWSCPLMLPHCLQMPSPPFTRTFRSYLVQIRSHGYWQIDLSEEDQYFYHAAWSVQTLQRTNGFYRYRHSLLHAWWYGHSGLYCFMMNTIHHIFTIFKKCSKDAARLDWLLTRISLWLQHLMWISVDILSQKGISTG